MDAHFWHIAMAISVARDDVMVSLSPSSKLGLKNCDLLLRRNKGVSMDLILGRLYAKADIFFMHLLPGV